MTHTLIQLLDAVWQQAHEPTADRAGLLDSLIVRQGVVTSALQRAGSADAARILSESLFAHDQPLVLDSLVPTLQRCSAHHLPEALPFFDESIMSRLHAHLSESDGGLRHFTRHDTLDESVRGWFDAQRMEAFSVLPLWNADVLLGYVLLADTPHAASWPEGTPALIQSLAVVALTQLQALEQAAVLNADAHTYQATQSQMDVRLRVADVAALMQQQTDMQTMMQVMTESLTHTLGASRTRIHLGTPTPQKDT